MATSAWARNESLSKRAPRLTTTRGVIDHWSPANHAVSFWLTSNRDGAVKAICSMAVPVASAIVAGRKVSRPSYDECA